MNTFTPIELHILDQLANWRAWGETDGTQVRFQDEDETQAALTSLRSRKLIKKCRDGTYAISRAGIAAAARASPHIQSTVAEWDRRLLPKELRLRLISRCPGNRHHRQAAANDASRKHL